MTRKIIIDTDPGIDDAMAIHLAFAHPGLEVVGLTTVFGNVDVERATRNALHLVGMAGRDCPVAAGAAEPLVQPPRPHGYQVHGDEGFGHLPAVMPDARPHRLAAAEFIIETVQADPGEITLLALGPLTNIALALRLDPAIAGKLAGVTVMGGAVEHRGNVTEWAEANVWHDPHAAAEVLGAPWPVTLIGLDVTEQTRCGPIEFARLADKAPVIGGFLNEAAQHYFGWHRRKGVHDGCFLHDPCAVLAVAEPRLFALRRVPVRVVTEGQQLGRTIADPDAGTPPIRVATGVDAEALQERFLTVLSTADSCRDLRGS